MDVALIPAGQKFSSSNHRNFIYSSSIEKILERYNIVYRQHAKNPYVKFCIEYTRDLLEHLEKNGYLHSKELSGWKYFYINDNSTDERLNTECSSGTLEIREPICIQRKNAFTKESLDILRFKSKCAAKLSQIINRCMDKKLEFNLELSDIESLLSETKCYYTGVPFDNSTNALTIDRIRSNQGYVKDNVVACSARVNSVKSILLESENPAFKDIYELKQFVDKLYALVDDEPFKDILL